MIQLARFNPHALMVVILAIATGVQTARLASEQRAHEKTRADAAEVVRDLEQQARTAEAAARATEQRWAASMEEISNDARAQIELAQADADAAALAGQRLRDRVAELTAACRRPASNPATASTGPATDATAGLLADMQRRLDEAADRIARHADDARAAGVACERAYGALREE